MESFDDSNELSPCYTCGVCETICCLNDLKTHGCVEGYDEIVTDENLYFYARTEDGNIVRRSLVDGVEQTVTDSGSTLCSRSVTNEGDKENAWNSKIRLEEQLIDEVRQRPPLWNFKLPLPERGVRIKERLWQEVSVKLNGTLSAKELKKKWKSLCDSFRAHCKKRKLPSGSAAATNTSWVHYESMKFLLDVHLESRTISNASNCVENPMGETEMINDSDIYSNIDSPYSSGFSGSSTISKRRKLDNESCLQEIAEALMRPIRFEEPLRMNVEVSRGSGNVEPEDSIKHFIRFMESDLRNIDDEDARAEIIRRLFEVLYDAKRELAKKRTQN